MVEWKNVIIVVVWCEAIGAGELCALRGGAY
jgi:hypothetical protein